MDRESQMRAWLDQTLEHAPFEVETASADASFRRYFRVKWLGRRAIVMDAPPDREDSLPFLRIGAALRAIGINCPEVLASSPEQGFVLLTDFGNTHYLQALTPDSADRLYKDAIQSLIRMQTRELGIPLPPYDDNLIIREMHLFEEWLVNRFLAIDLDSGQRTNLRKAYDMLSDSALEQPVVTVHRDFHSRNLMVVDNDNPGIIDFQDAVTGPVTYDLVSLLRDCYIEWPGDAVQKWCARYLKLARPRIPGIDPTTFGRWFDWMGLQRHLKAAGIFARLHIRDGKPAYLDDIPRTLAYLDTVGSRYPELSGLHDIVHIVADQFDRQHVRRR